MAQTMINIDDEALRAAAAEPGTRTKVETVNAALRLVAGRSERAASHHRLTQILRRTDLADPEVMAGLDR
jgi:Arc/MetJ family transcription regulator